MQGMMYEKIPAGRDADAKEEGVFGLAVCSGKMKQTGQDAQTKEEKEGRENERG